MNDEFHTSPYPTLCFFHIYCSFTFSSKYTRLSFNYILFTFFKIFFPTAAVIIEITILFNFFFLHFECSQPCEKLYIQIGYYAVILFYLSFLKYRFSPLLFSIIILYTIQQFIISKCYFYSIFPSRLDMSIYLSIYFVSVIHRQCLQKHKC